MKDLKDLILEAKLKSSNDPWVVLQNAFAQCVTHYDGHGSAGKYFAAPAGKSGLDGDQLDKVLEAVRKCADYDCEKEKMPQDEIGDKINNEGFIYIQPYVYDKRNNNGKGFIGFSIHAHKFELNLTEGYVVYKGNTPEYQNEYLNRKNAFLMNSGDFLELLTEVEWPKDNFTNVSKWDEFEDELNKIYNFLEE